MPLPRLLIWRIFFLGFLWNWLFNELLVNVEMWIFFHCVLNWRQLTNMTCFVYIFVSLCVIKRGPRWCIAGFVRDTSLLALVACEKENWASRGNFKPRGACVKKFSWERTLTEWLRRVYDVTSCKMCYRWVHRSNSRVRARAVATSLRERNCAQPWYWICFSATRAVLSKRSTLTMREKQTTESPPGLLNTFSLA